LINIQQCAENDVGSLGLLIRQTDSVEQTFVMKSDEKLCGRLTRPRRLQSYDAPCFFYGQGYGRNRTKGDSMPAGLSTLASHQDRIWNASKLLSLLACFASMLLPGCAGSPFYQLDLMPAPVAYEQTDTPFGVADAATPGGAVDMLYATNREPVAAGDQGDERYYSGERGYLVRLGMADITFGDSDITWDEARKISLLKNRPRSFPLEVNGVSE
jgi:hypothetical protein